jgi:hypothetical protein
LVGAAAFAVPLVLVDVLAGVLTTGVFTAGFAVLLAAGLAMVLAVVVMMWIEEVKKWFEKKLTWSMR